MEAIKCALHPDHDITQYCCQCNQLLCSYCSHSQIHSAIMVTQYKKITQLLCQAYNEPDLIQAYITATGMLPNTLENPEKNKVLNSIASSHQIGKQDQLPQKHKSLGNTINQKSHIYQTAVLKNEIELIKVEMMAVKHQINEKANLKYEKVIMDQLHENQQKAINAFEKLKYEFQQSIIKLDKENEKLCSIIKQLSIENITEKITRSILSTEDIVTNLTSAHILPIFESKIKELNVNDKIFGNNNSTILISTDFKDNFYQRAFDTPNFKAIENIAYSLTNALLTTQKDLFNAADNITSTIILDRFKELMDNEQKAMPIPQNVKNKIISNFATNFFERAFQASAINIADIIASSLTQSLFKKQKAMQSNEEIPQNAVIVMFNELMNTYVESNNELPINNEIKEGILRNFIANYYERAASSNIINIVEVIAYSLTVTLFTKEQSLFSDSNVLQTMIISKYSDLVNQYATTHNELQITEKIKNNIINKFKSVCYSKAIDLNVANIINVIACSLTIRLLNNEKESASNSELPSNIAVVKLKQLINDYANAQSELTISDKVKGAIMDNIESNFYQRAVNSNLILNAEFYNKADKAILAEYTVFKYSFIPKLIEWINKPCSFHLLFRASRDGFMRNDFHKHCDNKGPTLIIMKNSNDKIIGGYTPLAWESNSSFKCDDKLESFLFSMSTGKQYKLNGANKHKAIFCSCSDYGFVFGDNCFYSGINDCRAPNSCAALIESGTYYANETYNLFVGGSNESFAIVDYEVFEVHMEK